MLKHTPTSYEALPNPCIPTLFHSFTWFLDENTWSCRKPNNKLPTDDGSYSTFLVKLDLLKATAVTVLNQWFVTQYTQKIPMTHGGLSLLWWIWLSGIGNLQFVPRMPSSISSPRFFKSSNYLDVGPVQQNHTLFENMFIQWVKLTDIHHTHTYACTYVHICNYAYTQKKVCIYIYTYMNLFHSV
jgi:hypothetical protein